MTIMAIETVTRALMRVPTRRDVLRGLAATGLSLGLPRWGPAAPAANRPPHNKKKPKNNKKKQTTTATKF